MLCKGLVKEAVWSRGINGGPGHPTLSPHTDPWDWGEDVPHPRQDLNPQSPTSDPHIHFSIIENSVQLIISPQEPGQSRPHGDTNTE